MKHSRILIGVISLLVVVILVGAYLYATGFFDKKDKKALVVLPPKHIDKLYYFYDNSYFTYRKGTPLTPYWIKEYYKTHTWSIQKDGLNLTIYPEYVTGTFVEEMISFVVTLNASRYVEKVKYISDAIGMAKENGGFVLTGIVTDNYEDKRISYGDVNLPEDPDVGEWKIYKFNMANFSFLCHAYVHNDMKYTNASLPYNFTAYIETQNKIYKMEFMFNITDKQYPYLDSYYDNITGAKYFCYLNGNVVTSNHIVDGTQYYFMEKNGLLSKIMGVKK